MTGENAITKKCPKCGIVKAQGMFYKATIRPDGMSSWCKECSSDYDKKRDATESRRSNRSMMSDAKNKRRVAAYNAGARESILARNKVYYDTNKDKIIKRKIDRSKSSVELIAKSRISGLIRSSIRKHGYSKKSRTFEILGCSWLEFVSHIEKQFKEGMTWENRNLWHIDHIIPLATATCEDDIIRLNHFTNLRPLWAEENLRKSDKLEFIL